MTTGKALNGKPYAGNPHVRFDEGEVASVATPRRGSLLYDEKLIKEEKIRRAEAIQLAGERGYAEALPVLRKALSSPRRDAVLDIVAIGLIGDSSDISRLPPKPQSGASTKGLV